MARVIELEINRVVFEGMRNRSFKAFLLDGSISVGVRDQLSIREVGLHTPVGNEPKKYYTGRELLVRVTGILKSNVPGIVQGYYLISFDVN